MFDCSKPIVAESQVEPLIPHNNTEMMMAFSQSVN